MAEAGINTQAAPGSTSLRIRSLRPEANFVCCNTGNTDLTLPRIPASYLRAGDEIRVGAPASPVREFLAIQSARRQDRRHLYFGRIGYVTQPKTDKRDQYFVRAEVIDGSLGVRSLHITNPAVQSYFYFFTRRPGEEKPTTLYELLRADPNAPFADLRLCYRVRRLELSAQEARADLRSIERAFNLLAHPELRSCYDALLREPDAPALFPYGGFGQCVVFGDLAEDGETFFARRLLCYLPDHTQRRFRAPLRRIEFYDGYAVYRDSRRKAEVYIDRSLLPISWDPTWNQWKYLVGTKVGIAATFVEAGKYRRRDAEWHLVRWQTALASRLSLTLPSDSAEAINAARRTYQRFGEHYDAIERIRARLEQEPLDERELDDLCRRSRIPSDFDVTQFCWKPDYDPFFFQQLKKRSQNVYLFRSEYIFLLPRTVVAEIPQLGNATYVFAKPADIREFVHRYAATTRDDIRKNRGNVASELGFIGRVTHGSNPRHWLRALRLSIGETVDYSLLATP